ncbi:MOSC N-terminal beta barrel domain-containing protein [uncultured Pelagimonas sp.]|uniref:MOSC domain-containing protein n=1 Tax=uncultured Pelagimonas sp. TaxID=1618102 RepID=UPI00262DAE11|nr:MOSC N-terminal beta barrel domain-containing protein [uncultured Pelagimonas sp.]
MTLTLAEIWRFPIKSHGREPLSFTDLSIDKALPWDRAWAVAHDATQADGSEWVPCGQFSRGAKAPGLSAISAKLDEATQTVTLSHPYRDDLTFNPDTEGDKLIAWAGDFIPENRAQSSRVIRGQGFGFTDCPFQSITLGNMSSHRAVEQRVGHPLSIHRWRCNLWVDGMAPWEEFDWVGHQVQIGDAILEVVERTERCLATHNNPDTGRRDDNILGALDSWGHRDFTVQTKVVHPGRIQQGDKVQRL